MEKKDVSISLEKVLANLDTTENYFINVFENMDIDVGILRLRKGMTDTQVPHSIDEVYFVIEGEGHIEIEGKTKPVKSNDFIFIPANIKHKFVIGSKDLVVIYFFVS